MAGPLLPIHLPPPPGQPGSTPRRSSNSAAGSDSEPALFLQPAVLLVEDDIAIADMYRLGLERSGVDVTVARDGDEALLLAATLAHDLVVMDVGLPKRGGLEVIRALRSDPATVGIPLVVLSNYSEPAMLEEATDLGVLAYLVKADTTPRALVTAVRGWLNRRGD